MGAPEWLAEGGGSGSAAAQPGGTPFHIPPRELLVLAIVAAGLTVCLVCGCCACWLRRRRQRGRAAAAQPAGLAEPLNPHLQRPGEDHDRDMKDLMFVLLGRIMRSSSALLPRSLKRQPVAGGPLLDERDPGRSPRGYVVDSDATVPPQPLLWCPILLLVAHLCDAGLACAGGGDHGRAAPVQAGRDPVLAQVYYQWM